MTKPTHNLGAKIFACFLAIISGLMTLVSGVGVIFSSEYGFYGSNPVPYAETYICQKITLDYAERVMDWLNRGESIDALTDIQPEKTNFRYNLYLPNGRNVATNLYFDDEQLSFVESNQYSLYYDLTAGSAAKEAYGITDSSTVVSETATTAVALDEPKLVTMDCYITDPPTVADRYWFSYLLYQKAFELHNPLILLLLVNLLILAVSVVFLLCAAGRQDGKDEIVLNLQDRIPLDLYFGILFTLLAAIASIGYPNFTYNIHTALFWFCVLVFIGILLLAALMTCATRLKLGKYFYQNTITYKVLRFCWKMFAAVFSTFGDVIGALPMVWKVAVAWLVVSSVYIGGGGGGALLLNLVLLFVFCSIASQLQKLKKAGEHLAKGNLDYRVDTKKMFRSFRQHGEHLNSISKGFSIALNQKMKSERMKTELITNVSHDIKTPLTSIINYVDLLKKEGLEGQAAEYIEVLDRQSRRLKKLTEDLVEASKASTGNLKVHLAPTDLGELAAQAIAEYEEKLEKSKLEVVLSGTETPVYAMVDGNLTWRVLSNLLSNTCKYSQTGTRVYIDLKQERDTVTLSMKNISKDALNIPAEELMERFVRGDSSRHTEGSGLGLNIAQSLVGLQKGKFLLEIDGDLFKAYVKFPAAEPPAPPAEEMPMENQEPPTPQETPSAPSETP